MQSTITWPILSVLIWLPIAGGVAMLLLGDKNIALGMRAQGLQRQASAS